MFDLANLSAKTQKSSLLEVLTCIVKMVRVSLALSSALLLQALSASAKNIHFHRRESSSALNLHSTPFQPTTTRTSTTSIRTRTETKTSSKPLITTTLTGASSGVPIASPSVSTVPPASESIATSTVTPTSIVIASPATPTSSDQIVAVANPDDPSQSATFVKQDVPAYLKDQIPSIPDGTMLPLIVTVGGVATPIIVSSAGIMVVPVGTVPAWLTPEMFPSPDSIVETDDASEGDDTSSASTSTASASSTSTGSASTSITITITTDLESLTVDAVDGLTSFPPGTGVIPTTSAPSTTENDSAPTTVAEQPSSTSTDPPMPSETSGNNKGSALCKSLAGACKIAYQGYSDDFLYTGYTSYVASVGENDAINWLFAPFADNGCAAMFSCQDYSVGMTGAQIKQAVENMVQSDDVKECGSTYLSNGCQVTLNGCNDCKPSIPCGAVPSDVQWDGCY